MKFDMQGRVNRNPPALVIFDCDGVLVDSEMMSAGVLMGMMEEIGLPITSEIFRSDFLGRSFGSAALRVAERFGRPMPDDFQLKYRDRLLARMRATLKPMAGVEKVLRHMSVPYCLATGSSPQRLKVSLQETDLEHFFLSRAYTASEVKHGKPAPDLLLHAAKTMSADPAHCLVIEDSVMGIEAARNAGMEVWHFAGGAHFKDGYSLPVDARPQRALDSMDALHEAFVSIGVCGV